MRGAARKVCPDDTRQKLQPGIIIHNAGTLTQRLPEPSWLDCVVLLSGLADGARPQKLSVCVVLPMRAAVGKWVIKLTRRMRGPGSRRSTFLCVNAKALCLCIQVEAASSDAADFPALSGFGKK